MTVDIIQRIAVIEVRVGPRGANGTNGVGVPAGGTTGQVLTKASGTDYDTEWSDPSGGTGSEGPPGPPGASAYEIAVENGFVGTEVEWLASLEGAQGPQGIQGIQGPAGATGATGPQGPAGPTGPAGADGAPGAPGADGASAYEIAVANGFVGTEAQWLFSLKGDQGEPGLPGADGAPGAPGADGIGVPAGGAEGYVLRKASATDYDTEWSAPNAHTHSIANVTGLQTALDGKAATSHTHNASDITAGTLDAARLPTPTTTALGGVMRNAGTAGQFVNGINPDGSLAYGTPAGGGGGGKIAQIVATTDATSKTTAFTIPFDNTKPQNTEGTEYTELATTITPTNASSKLLIEVKLWVSSSGINTVVAALFKDSGADALSTGWVTNPGGGYANELSFRFYTDAGSTSAQTFKVRWGVITSGTVYLNNSNGTSYMGGTLLSSMTITEILP